VDKHHDAHVHEPSPTMTVPLLILAVMSIAAGYFGIPEFLAPVFEHEGGSAHDRGGLAIMLLATAMGILGIAGAYYAYVLHPSLPDRWAQQWRTAYEWSLHKWYVDEAYDRSIVRPTFTVAVELWKRIDVAVIDGAVNGVARAIAWGAWFLRLVQSGQTQHYALGMAFGAVVILTLLMVM
jgi:NADH-quinone oxidoreductase subunit L